MKTRPGTSLLIVGLVLFIIGLLMILQDTLVISFFSKIFPNTEIVEATGVLLQFVGEILVIFVAMRSISSKFLSSVETERQVLIAGFNQTTQRIENRLVTIQALAARAQTSPPTITSSNCRFCGTKYEQSPFCPKCGKARS